MVETGRAFYPPGEKVHGLVYDADILQYPYLLHIKCSLIVRDREMLMKYKSN